MEVVKVDLEDGFGPCKGSGTAKKSLPFGFHLLILIQEVTLQP